MESDSFEATLKDLLNKNFKKISNNYNSIVYRKTIAYEMRLMNMDEDFKCPIVFDGNVELGMINFDILVNQCFIVSIVINAEFVKWEEDRFKRFLEAANKQEGFLVLVSLNDIKIFRVKISL